MNKRWLSCRFSSILFLLALNCHTYIKVVIEVNWDTLRFQISISIFLKGWENTETEYNIRNILFLKSYQR